MKKIQITYSTSKLGTALYMVLFFRSVGVYVYEKIISSHSIPVNKIKYPSIEADLEIIILDRRGLLHNKNFLDQSRCVYLIEKAAGLEGGIVYADHVVFITGKEKNKNVLAKVIEEISLIDEDMKREKESLQRLVRIYNKHHIMEAMLSTRFYYGLKDNYYILYQYYEKAVREIEEEIANPRIYHSNYEYYAFIYYAYEIDYYCKRLNVPFVFSAESLLSLANDLKKNSKRAKWNTWDLLIAQIYDDLKNDTKMGYKYYESSARNNDSNSFAWYKMGEIWKGEYKSYERAKQCFAKAVSISPIYYKAVYRQAECEYQLGNREEALKQYEYVIKILNQRIIGGIILPMHIEYAFQTYFHMGRIWSGDMNAPFQAISAYKNAEEIWNSIESVEQNSIVQDFIFKRKGTVSLMQDLYQKTKQLLDIKAVRERLAVLYLVVGEKELADYYIEKLKNEII